MGRTLIRRVNDTTMPVIKRKHELNKELRDEQ
ncbi:hypothetical protein QBD01_003383 [Ochrobactrum sp. 19YEA23]|nr:hypothetical protein [Ochrobactrum sp. 19YEA23]